MKPKAIWQWFVIHNNQTTSFIIACLLHGGILSALLHQNQSPPPSILQISTMQIQFESPENESPKAEQSILPSDQSQKVNDESLISINGLELAMNKPEPTNQAAEEERQTEEDKQPDDPVIDQTSLVIPPPLINEPPPIIPKPKLRSESQTVSITPKAENQSTSSNDPATKMVTEISAGRQDLGGKNLEAQPSNPSAPKGFFQLGSANNPLPPYPLLARQKGWEGVVRLLVEVRSTNKQAERVWILASSGFKALDQAALTTVKEWQFSLPVAQTNPSPDRSYIFEVPINFKLSQP